MRLRRWPRPALLALAVLLVGACSVPDTTTAAGTGVPT
jgi:hypothetical protein